MGWLCSSGDLRQEWLGLLILAAGGLGGYWLVSPWIDPAVHHMFSNPSPHTSLSSFLQQRQYSKRGSGARRISDPQVWNQYTVTSITFYWSKQVARPVLMQRIKRWTKLLLFFSISFFFFELNFFYELQSFIAKDTDIKRPLVIPISAIDLSF